MSLRVLVVEDDREIRALMQSSLSVEGFEVQTAVSLSEASALLRHDPPDVIVLDLGLPDGDGVELVQEVRKRHALPIIVVSARHQEAQKIRLLDAGADDYLTKPFAFEELVARVRALMRRRAEAEPALLQVADLILDPARRVVSRGGEKIELTAKEFALLEYLMHNPGRVLTRTLMIEHVWNYDFDTTTNIIDVYVNYLRKKIDSGRETKLIHTVRGVGYVLKAE